MEPIVAKGDKIMWKGDLVCVARIDCFPGDPMTVDTFEWYKDKPSLGEPIHPALMAYLGYRIAQKQNSRWKSVGRDQ